VILSVEICVDVPDLVVGIRFYSQAFGFAKVAEPYPGVAVLQAGELNITLLQKPAGSNPSPNTQDVRKYERHWTPVHLDFHVENLKAAVDKAVQAGAIAEQTFDHPEHGGIAFCSDPFGNGFCLLQRKAK
jgi:predicted enzyme related to lactoylglutathione lyase